MAPQEFSYKDVQCWDDLIKTIKPSTEEGRWLYRGQAHDWCLKSTLERQVSSWEINSNHAPSLERALAREFRRRVRGEEHALIQDDMLNCLALMRHHGAPTRLLDCTYSPFVAAQTALREGLDQKHVPVIWCFSTEWMNKHCTRILGRASVKLGPDGRRIRFDALLKRSPPAKIVAHDNPYFLNQRLTAHQGAFLFAGDIRIPFCENLKSMKGWDLGENVCKLYLRFDRVGALKILKRMNVSSTVLFPGLDGFARSLGEELRFYDEVYGGRA
jgi:FRG domain